MTKSEMFKKAHEVARSTVGIVGDYMIAFSIALKGVYKMSNTQTANTQIESEKREALNVDHRTFDMDRYFPKQAAFIRKIVNHAISKGYNVRVYDGEEWATKYTKDKEQIFSNLAACDEEAIYFTDANRDRVGCVYLIWDRDNECDPDQVIYDYTANDRIDDLINFK